MPRNICNVRSILVLLRVAALMVPPAHFAQSPSGQRVPPAPSPSESKQSNPPTSTRKNAIQVCPRPRLTKAMLSATDKLSHLRMQIAGAQMFSLF